MDRLQGSCIPANTHYDKPQEVPEGPAEISRRYRRAQECVLTLYHSFQLKAASFLGGAPSPATSTWGRCDHEEVTVENYRQINLGQRNQKWLPALLRTEMSSLRGLINHLELGKRKEKNEVEFGGQKQMPNHGHAQPSSHQSKTPSYQPVTIQLV